MTSNSVANIGLIVRGDEPPRRIGSGVGIGPSFHNFSGGNMSRGLSHVADLIVLSTHAL